MILVADLVLADRVMPGGALVIEGDRIADVALAGALRGSRDERIDLTGRTIVPGLIDAHVHGSAGHDVLDGPDAVAAVALALPRWGVTAFSPTSIACDPGHLDTLLTAVAAARARPHPLAARVLPAHLESNFISPDYRGAQPLASLCGAALDAAPSAGAADFSARDILAVIDRHRADIAAITIAPELDGGLALIRAFRAGGITVSLGHSGATFDQGTQAIAAGARRATHLFNRMSPMTHRDPGLPGAVLASDEITAEIICDGRHVHAAMIRFAVGVKGASRVMAITDGTAGSGLPDGSRTRLGGQPVTVRDVARLDDGTMAGSVTTMDRVLACLITETRIDLVRAIEMCATTPARHLGLTDQGLLAPGYLADFTVLAPNLTVLQTWIGGRRVYARPGDDSHGGASPASAR